MCGGGGRGCACEFFTAAHRATSVPPRSAHGNVLPRHCHCCRCHCLPACLLALPPAAGVPLAPGWAPQPPDWRPGGGPQVRHHSRVHRVPAAGGRWLGRRELQGVARGRVEALQRGFFLCIPVAALAAALERPCTAQSLRQTAPSRCLTHCLTYPRPLMPPAATTAPLPLPRFLLLRHHRCARTRQPWARPSRSAATSSSPAARVRAPGRPGRAGVECQTVSCPLQPPCSSRHSPHSI